MLTQDYLLGSLLVLPMELWNGLMDETTIKYTETGGTYGFPNWLFGCSARITELTEFQSKRTLSNPNPNG